MEREQQHEGGCLCGVVPGLIVIGDWSHHERLSAEYSHLHLASIAKKS